MVKGKTKTFAKFEVLSLTMHKNTESEREEKSRQGKGTFSPIHFVWISWEVNKTKEKSHLKTY